MDATLILIDSDTELARARALVDELWNSNNPADVARLEASAPDRRVRGKEMASPAAERRRSDPPPYGSAWSHASGPSPAPRHPKPRE